MSYKVAAVLAAVGLLLVVSSILYGRTSPIAGSPQKTEERIKTVTARHAHIVAAAQAQERRKDADQAIERLREISEKSAQLSAERKQALARQKLVTNGLRYGGCIFLLAGALTVLAKTQS